MRIRGLLESGAEPGLNWNAAQRQSSEADDGLLTATEVAQLRLNADLVVLSACNTAARETDTEALSGLARDRFSTRAATLLVSHWPLVSGAAARLTSKAFAALAKGEPEIGPAEALRRSIVAMLQDESARRSGRPPPIPPTGRPSSSSAKAGEMTCFRRELNLAATKRSRPLLAQNASQGPRSMSASDP